MMFALWRWTNEGSGGGALAGSKTCLGVLRSAEYVRCKVPAVRLGGGTLAIEGRTTGY